MEMTLRYEQICFDNCNLANINGIYLSMEFLISVSVRVDLQVSTEKELQYDIKGFGRFAD